MSTTIFSKILRWKFLNTNFVISLSSIQQSLFCKIDILFCQVSMLWTLVDLFWMKRLFSQGTDFAHAIVADINKNKFDARGKFGTGALCRIFNCSTEHTNLPGHSKHLSPNSLSRNNRYHFPRKQANTTKEHLSIPLKQIIFNQVVQLSFIYFVNLNLRSLTMMSRKNVSFILKPP